MNKAELPARIATETSLSRAGANGAATAVFSLADDDIASCETVKIAGFEIFSMKSQPAYPIHHRHVLSPK